MSGLPFVSNIQISLFKGQIAIIVESPFHAKHWIPGNIRLVDWELYADDLI
jgi:hypothetical protein